MAYSVTDFLGCPPAYVLRPQLAQLQQLAPLLLAELQGLDSCDDLGGVIPVAR